MTQPLTQFTHDNIPPLPMDDGPLPVHQPMQQMQRQPGGLSTANGIPRFELVPVRNKDGSFQMVEYVDILTPGDNKAAPRHKVNDAIRQRYAAHYDLWKRGLQESPVGTPLEAWPVLTTAQVTVLKAVNIFTVEQLRDTPDSNLHRIPMGRTLKNRASQWLDTKGRADAVDAMAREKEALVQGQQMLEEQLRQTAEQNRLLNERLARLEARETQSADAAPTNAAPAQTGKGGAAPRK